jgi:hypothetical protein
MVVKSSVERWGAMESGEDGKEAVESGIRK